MTINTVTEYGPPTDLGSVDFSLYIDGLADYWRTSAGDQVSMELVVDELENWGETRTSWVSALEAFTTSVEKQLLIAFEGDEKLSKGLEHDVLLLEAVDGMLATIDNRYASVDRSSFRSDMVYAMAMALDPSISTRGVGIIADAAVDFREDERRAALRPRRTSLKPVAFHRPGRMAEELEDGFPDADICRCGECGSR